MSTVPARTTCANIHGLVHKTSGTTNERGKVALDVRVVKKKSTQWLVGFSDYLKFNPDMVVNGIKAAGVVDSIENKCDIENARAPLTLTQIRTF